MTGDGFMEFLAEKERNKGIRPELLPGTVSYYDYDISKYPDRIRVSFADGKTLVYELRTEQPHPIIVENINIIKRMKQGYVNQPVRRRRPK